jgi:hypothetical protein
MITLKRVPTAQTERIEKRAVSSLSLKNSHMSHTRRDFRNRQSPLIPNPQKDSEILSVMNLDYWEGRHASDVKRTLDQARIDLNKKLNNEDLVELQKTRRQSLFKSSSTNDLTKQNARHIREFERTLIETYEEIHLKLSNSLEKRENLRKKLCEVKEEVYNFQKKLEKIPSQFAQPPSQKLLKKSGSDVASYLSQKLNIKEQINKLTSEYKQNIEMLQIEISCISRELSSCDQETSSARHEMKVAKNELVFHYSSLLKEGKDTRNEGLSWILKALKNLGKEIRKEMMPNDMDDKSIDVVMRITKISRKLDEFYEKLIETKPASSQLPEDKLPIQERLMQIKKYLIVRKPEYGKQKRMSWAGSEVLEYQSSALTKGTLSDAIKIEEAIKDLKSQILDIQTQEVKRITKECLKTGHNLKSMISRIVGQENIEKFLIVCTKELREIEAMRKSISTFTFTAKLMPKPTTRGILNSIFM